MGRHRLGTLLARQCALLALLLVAMLVAVATGAGPASAILLHLPSGKQVSYAPMTRNAALVPGAVRAAPSQFAGVGGNLAYGGGPVMTSNTDYVIAWMPSNYSGPLFHGGGVPAQGFVYGIDQYFRDLASDSGGNANPDSIANQYNGPGGIPAGYQSRWGGEIDDTDPLPPSGCSYAGSSGACITDQQIQTELDHVLTQHGLPRDLAHEYFLVSPPGLVNCFVPSGAAGCSANASSNAAYCGYHTNSAAPQSFLYAVIPDLDGIAGCDPFVSSPTCLGAAGGCEYDNTFADGVISTISHEQIESMTDPQPNTGWSDWQSCGQGTPETCGGEIADKCNGDEANPAVNSGTTYQYDSSHLAYMPSNTTINGRRYWLQLEWSNQGSSCQRVLSTLDPPPGSSFTYTSDPSSRNTIDFNAGASCGTGACNIADYVWQFNDSRLQGQPPQNTTFSTTSPVIAHTFPAFGFYTVALTTMTSDGRSFGFSEQVPTIATTQAAFGFSPATPTDAAAVTFNGTASTHDSLVSIASYNWNFGDGSVATGAVVSHRFAAGPHVVTLLVIDSLGGRSIVSHTLVVTRGCHVPSLKGKSLSSARAALRSSNCAVGRITKPSHARRRARLVVVGQSPKPRALRARGYAVDVRLGYR